MVLASLHVAHCVYHVVALRQDNGVLRRTSKHTTPVLLKVHVAALVRYPVVEGGLEADDGRGACQYVP